MSMCTTTEPTSQSTPTNAALRHTSWDVDEHKCELKVDETKLPPTRGMAAHYPNLAAERVFIEGSLRANGGMTQAYFESRLAEVNEARDKAIFEMLAEMATTQPDDTDPDVEQQIVETVVDDPKVPEVQEDSPSELDIDPTLHPSYGANDDLPWPYSDYFAMPGAPMAPAGLLRVSALPLTARLGHKDWE